MDLGTAHLTPGPHPVREGIVSVVLVNYKGAADTIVCLKACLLYTSPSPRDS